MSNLLRRTAFTASKHIRTPYYTSIRTFGVVNDIKEKAGKAVNDTINKTGQKLGNQAENEISGHDDHVAEAGEDQLNKLDNKLGSKAPKSQKYERNQPTNHPSRDEASRKGESSSAHIQD